MHHGGAVLAGALLLHQVHQLQSAADGTVGVRPAGGTVVLQLQDKVILPRGGIKTVTMHHGKASLTTNEAANIFFLLLMTLFPVSGVPHLRRLQHVVPHSQHVLVGQTHVILAPQAHGERLQADSLPLAWPHVTKLRPFPALLLLTTQEVSR